MVGSYVLKEKPKDFIVEEINGVHGVINERFLQKLKFNDKSDGKFLRCVLVKRDVDTISTFKILSRCLGIKEERISVAGLKDKKAVTYQMISFMNTKKDDVEKRKDCWEKRGIRVVPVEYGDKVFLGDLEGNRFTIVVRNVEGRKEEIEKRILNKEREMGGFFLNFFGEQRFANGKTWKMGKFIVKREWKDAINTFFSTDETEIERKVKEYLKENKEDYLGALKQIPLNLLKLYVHAYQSFLFNRTLERMVEKGKLNKEMRIPLVGYGHKSRILKTEVDEILDEIMEEEGIKAEMFRIQEIEEISSEGSMRKAFERYKNFSVVKVEDDDIYKAKKKVTLSFELPKGCYATVFLEQLLSDRSMFNITNI